MARLSDAQLEQFITDGYTRLDHVFSPEIAKAGCEILWRDTRCDPNDPTTWTEPVIRLGEYGHPPFYSAVTAPLLHTAFDQLVGSGRWIRRTSIGTFPIRFPSSDDPGDTGWHVDASFPGKDPHDYLSWRINVKSRGRALLMLFLFSDVTDLDAPTRLAPGSHLEVARLLQTAGDDGLSFMELAQKLCPPDSKSEIQATGRAGTVYLCHPFIAHAAQAHRGKNPRFMAQPPLLAKTEFELHRIDNQYVPVEQAIRKGVRNTAGRRMN